VNQRNRAWFCICCVAMACSESRTLSDPSPSTQLADAGKRDPAIDHRAELSGAGPAGGTGVGVGATAGAGGQHNGQTSGNDCSGLSKAIQNAVDAFTATSPNSCSKDSDCTVISTAIARNGAVCAGGCGMVVASAYGAERSAFLAHDPAITAACTEFLQAGCADTGPRGCPCTPFDPALGGCRPPRCASGACE
jgi:hypothetical protein